MDILTLELFDRSISQVLGELNRALEAHPTMALRIYLDGEEMLLHNVQRLLERHGRRSTTTSLGPNWQVDVTAGTAKAPVPQSQPITAPPLEPAFRPTPSAKPIVLLHSAFSPGDRALGRRLLLGILRQVESPTPWILLAHEALELLQDPHGLEVLETLRRKGIPVKLSQESLDYWSLQPGAYEVMEDSVWQALVGRDALVILG
jgi:hypothetical protein